MGDDSKVVNEVDGNSRDAQQILESQVAPEIWGLDVDDSISAVYESRSKQVGGDGKMKNRIASDKQPHVQTPGPLKDDHYETITASFVDPRADLLDPLYPIGDQKISSTKWNEIFNKGKRITIQKKPKKVDSLQQHPKIISAEGDRALRDAPPDGSDRPVLSTCVGGNSVLSHPQKSSGDDSISLCKDQSSHFGLEISKPTSNREKQRSRNQIRGEQRPSPVSNSLSMLYASRKVLPSNSEFAVLKLVNISWNLGISDIISYFSSVQPAIGHQPPHYTHTIHIIMNRDTGKTHSECFVEFPTYYDALTAMEMHPRGIMKGRMVTTQWSSQHELFNLLFPNQTVFPAKKCTNSDKQYVDAPVSPIESGLNNSTEDKKSCLLPKPTASQRTGVFLQREEINAILVICKNYKLHFSRKCAERPFENIISIITKVPWNNYDLISPTHRDHLFEMIKLGLDSLKVHLEKCDIAMDKTLFTRMLRAGLCAPLFTERQKKTLLSVAGTECPPDMAQFVYPSAGDKCAHIQFMPPPKQAPAQIAQPSDMSSPVSSQHLKQDFLSPKLPAGSFFSGSSPHNVALSRRAYTQKCDAPCARSLLANDYRLEIKSGTEYEAGDLRNCPDIQLADGTSLQSDRHSDLYYEAQKYYDAHRIHYSPSPDGTASPQALGPCKTSLAISGINDHYITQGFAQDTRILPTACAPSSQTPLTNGHSPNKYESFHLQTQILMSKVKSLEIKLLRSYDRCEELSKRVEIAESGIILGTQDDSNALSTLEQRCKELESTLSAKERSNVQLELRLRKIQEIITRHAENSNVSRELRAEIEDQTITGPWGGFLGGNSILLEGVKDLWDK